MIHFNLNIDLFYESELKNDSEVKAIACIEVPVLHLIAKTLEIIEEEYDAIDRFIVQTAYVHQGFSIMQFSEMTGLSPIVFNSRAKELEKQEYISIIKDKISPREKGIKFLNDPTFERKIEKTRSFLLDGTTHEPLKSYFYKDGRENLISEKERDSYGNKLFSPAIIHNPPSKNIKEIILNIPIEERTHYNIPVGLKDIKDYDFVLMTYPVAIVFLRSNQGKTVKKLIDLNGFYSDEDCVSHWRKSLNSELRKVEIVIEERDVIRNEAQTKKALFKNNWGKTRTSIDNRILNVTKDKLKQFILKLYSLANVNDDNIVVNEFDIKIVVDKKLFEIVGADKKKLIEACLRKRDYYRQYEGTGIWLIFIQVVVGDEFIQSLVDLHQLLVKETTVNELLLHHKNNYKLLRKNLIAIERYDKLEELDVYLFLHKRESNFVKNYLSIINE